VLGRRRIQVSEQRGEEVELRLQAAGAAGTGDLGEALVHLDDRRRALLGARAGASRSWSGPLK